MTFPSRDVRVFHNVILSGARRRRAQSKDAPRTFGSLNDL